MMYRIIRFIGICVFVVYDLALSRSYNKLTQILNKKWYRVKKDK